uniref:Uncharacterized protein n=1 Tax=Mycena chlorophos TaxID=658473 RepID=A0ABQ0KXC1_MYCCL|nr:predicted protein [Mycena chlorophos]
MHFAFNHHDKARVTTRRSSSVKEDAHNLFSWPLPFAYAHVAQRASFGGRCLGWASNSGQEGAREDGQNHLTNDVEQAFEEDFLPYAQILRVAMNYDTATA